MLGSYYPPSRAHLIDLRATIMPHFIKNPPPPKSTTGQDQNLNYSMNL